MDKILVVDDEATNVMVLSAMLAKEGYQTIIATNGLEAVEKFKEEGPDLILMDVMMPVMDGYQATKEIKSISNGKFTPVIFLTALSDDESLAKCVESGGDDFLTKPYSRIILKSKINAFKRIQRLTIELNDKNHLLQRLNDDTSRDIDLANHVYQSIIQRSCLDDRRLNFRIEPVSSFNGDIILSSRTPSGTYHILVGDLTGHGLSAALGSIPISELFYSMTESGYDIKSIIVELNEKLIQSLPVGYFCAAAIFSLDPVTQQVSIFNAGLPDIFVIGESRKIISSIYSDCFPLGVSKFNESEINLKQVQLKPYHSIFAYTDGVTEIFDNSNTMFGKERLVKYIDDSKSEMIDLNDLRTHIDKYRGEILISDDISMLEILYHSINENSTDSFDYNLSKSVYSWELSMEFSSQSLRFVDPVMIVVDAVMNVSKLTNHRDRIYTIFAELINNSLEHGLLELDSSMKNSIEGFTEYYSLREERLHQLDEGFIHVDLNHKAVNNGGILEVNIRDSGKGFDYQHYKDRTQNTKKFSGRGIMLVNTICDELQYSDHGKHVMAVYHWKHN